MKRLRGEGEAQRNVSAAKNIVGAMSLKSMVLAVLRIEYDEKKE